MLGFATLNAAYAIGVSRRYIESEVAPEPVLRATSPGKLVATNHDVTSRRMTVIANVSGEYPVLYATHGVHDAFGADIGIEEGKRSHVAE